LVTVADLGYLVYGPVPTFESCVFRDSSHTTSGCPFFEKVATRSGETRSYFYTLWFCLVCHVLKLLLYNGFHFSEIIFYNNSYYTLLITCCCLHSFCTFPWSLFSSFWRQLGWNFLSNTFLTTFVEMLFVIRYSLMKFSSWIGSTGKYRNCINNNMLSVKYSTSCCIHLQVWFSLFISKVQYELLYPHTGMIFSSYQ
jgi:hypothetical protein